jgi:hypothetical protein
MLCENAIIMYGLTKRPSIVRNEITLSSGGLLFESPGKNPKHLHTTQVVRMHLAGHEREDESRLDLCK